MTACEVIQRLQQEGWYEVRQTKHKHFAHPTKPGIVTVPIHGGKNIPKGTLANIKRQAGWR